MASIHSARSVNKKIVRFWYPGNTNPELIQQFHMSVHLNLTEASQQLDADFCLLDRRSTSGEHLKSQLITPHLPILIVIDEQCNTNAFLEASTDLDISRCEFINATELNTPILDLRIRKLICCAEKQQSQSAESNAEIILQTVMKHSNDWLVVKNLDNRFLYVSGKFCRSYNKTKEQIIGLNDLELGTPPELVFGKPGAEWKGYWALDKEVTDSGVPLQTAPLLLDQDLNMFESMDKVPLRNSSGEVFALVVSVYRFIQDPAKSNTAEDNLEDGKSSHLWDRKSNLPNNPALFSINNERIKAEELKHRSETAFIAKNRFIAAASHDLRQPLHALGLYIGALEPSVSEQGQPLLEKIQSCISALNDLLTSLLDISKLDAKVVSAEMSDFKIGELLQSLRTECLSIARGKSLEIVCSSEEYFVSSDKVLLRRVIRNLLFNALNYTVQGNITLSAIRIGNHIEVVVADTGCGIPTDKQKLVFEEFVKIESTPVGTQHGLGLGLSIVKRLCIILGVGLRLDSEVGNGTQVYLTIPLGLRVSDVVDKDKLDSGKLDQAFFGVLESGEKRKKVLVIDDDVKVCEAVEAILQQQNYEVVTATRVDDALLMLRQSSTLPDVMVVDFRLSENITGLDAIEMIVAECQKTIPALIVTGDTTEDGLNKIIDSGHRHLHKPVEVGNLLEMLHKTVTSPASKKF